MGTEAKKRSVGRPTKYKSEYCEQIVEYFRVYPKVMYPRLNDFAHNIGVASSDTLQDWADQHPEFLRALKSANDIRKEHIYAGGIEGRFNPTMCVWTGKVIFGDKEMTTIEHTGTGGGPLIIETNVKVAEDASGD